MAYDQAVAILGTGPSMSQDLADRVREKFSCVIAVSDAYRLAEDADVLVSSDRAWWIHHNPDFKGTKYAAPQLDRLPGVGHVKGVPSSTNSGALAVRVAREMLKARQVFMFGFDMHRRSGSHFFGDHPPELKNTPDHRWKIFQDQFGLEERLSRNSGCKIYNCTPGSDLLAFEIVDPREVLGE